MHRLSLEWDLFSEISEVLGILHIYTANSIKKFLCSFSLESFLLIHWRGKWQPTPVLLPGKSSGRRGLVGYSPRGCEESDTTEQLHFHFSLLCIGEGNGNPLQYSCLENPRDRGSWWAATYGIAQSQTQLKQLSSSSSLDRKSFNGILWTKWNIRVFKREPKEMNWKQLFSTLCNKRE